MIKYSLICTNGHEFESWFPSGQHFDQQSDRGLVTCPICQSAKVNKAVMAPHIVRTDNRTKQAEPEIIPPALAPAAPATPVALLDDQASAVRAAVRELRTKLIENSVDVGDKFPEEARKIHDGSTPARSIRGQASIGEARALLEEGIPLLPIPDLPEELN
ncbi:MAG: DUF1178 family protein [Methylocystaceae bacterium]|nr:DUF1178 family protein [Methylocystaceae bacterium]